MAGRPRPLSSILFGKIHGSALIVEASQGSLHYIPVDLLTDIEPRGSPQSRYFNNIGARLPKTAKISQAGVLARMLTCTDAPQLAL
ncbi:hypothetical protein D3C86_1944360 [compost metagenome]